jgi:hypothetical protein
MRIMSRLTRSLRAPSRRVAAALAAAMLGIGVAIGAAIGPAPDSSQAGSSLATRLPLLLAALAAKDHASTPAQTAAAEPPPAAPNPVPAAAPAASSQAPSTPAAATGPAATSPASSEPTGSTAPTSTSKLAPTTNVWLIELGGGGFAQALAQPAAAPYITGQLLPAGTYLSGWSALAASTFANDAALAQPSSPGSPPPLLHSIVQPPCPEGAAGASCAPETPGQLTAADEFLKTTLATIISTPGFREHGLVVVTFTTVALAGQQGLPAAASTATLTSTPPTGAALLSPFAARGARPTTAFDPTSPEQSLTALLH